MKRITLFIVFLAMSLSLLAAPRQYVLFEVVTGTW